MKLEYELIDEDNINLATSIQHTIFPDECAYVHYKYAIDTNYKRNKYFIIKWNAIPVGVIGLYMDAEIDNESIWLGWFGILPEFRSKGIGRKSILDMIEKAKEYNKKYFRLYTNDKGDSTARSLYRSVMQLYENYNNPNDYNYDGNCLIYSYSLCDEKVSLWNDKFLNLKEDIQDEKQGNNLWNDKYKILILSNQSNDEFIEDIYLATSFREDGHIVKMAWVDYDENLDDKFHIIIRRNTWVENKEETNLYKIKNNKMKERLKERNIKTVNLEGLDGQGKSYLCKLFKEGKKVIPTIDKIEDINKINETGEYVLKDNDSFGSGIGQKFVKKEDLEKEFQKGYLIQPKLKFKSEIQCYFIGNKLMYVYEYTPSKYPNYPEPKLITLNEKDKKLSEQFADISNLKVGFQRIDFLKLENNELILLEIEDNSPHMNLEKLDIALRKNVLNEYKRNIYQFLNK